MLAEAAARASHDGVAVDAAVSWTAMEAEAFNSANVDHLLDTGLTYIPKDPKLRALIVDIRRWVKADNDWQKTRQRIEDNYGHHKYGGICHMIPNHDIIILALLYGSHSFPRAIHIINTCGWDTDCNSGNVRCLFATMHGLNGFRDDKCDWRGPLADRAIISNADPGYGINDAAQIACNIMNAAARSAGFDTPKLLKNAAKVHFSLPESTLGFQSCDTDTVQVLQDQIGDIEVLSIEVIKDIHEEDNVEVMVQTFTPK